MPPSPNRDVEAFRNEIETTLRALQRQFKADLVRFRREYDELLRAARNGLLGETNIPGGKNDLARVQNAIINDPRKTREAFIIETFRMAIWPFLFGLFLFTAAFAFSKSGVTGSQDIFKWVGPFALMHIGIALGVLLSAMISSITPTLEQIAVGFDQYGFSPRLRFIYVTTIAWVLYVLMATELVIIGITKTFNDQMRQLPVYGIVIGLICALADEAVTALINLRVRAVIRSGTTGK